MSEVINVAVLLNNQQHLQKELAELKKDHQRLKEHLDEYERAEAAKERKNLYAGIALLGGCATFLVSALGTIIWTYKKAILG